MTPSLPYQWFDTPDIRFATVKDFRDMCRSRGFKVEMEALVPVGGHGHIRDVKALPEQRATSALFLLSR